MIPLKILDVLFRGWSLLAVSYFSYPTIIVNLGRPMVLRLWNGIEANGSTARRCPHIEIPSLGKVTLSFTNRMGSDNDRGYCCKQVAPSKPPT